MDEPSARWSANLVAPSGTGLRALLAGLVDCHNRKRAIARADLHLLTSQRLPGPPVATKHLTQEILNTIQITRQGAIAPETPAPTNE
jgi:hypothetical protein